MLHDGSFVQPESEKERKTMPVTRDDAVKIIRIGEMLSLAHWCGLNWRHNYLRLTKPARNNGLNGKQVAFVGSLHGVVMGMVDSALKERDCMQEIKANIATQLKNISREPIKLEPVVPYANEDK